MDPTKALEELLARLDELKHVPTEDNRVNVMEQLEHLHRWIRTGGFAPDVAKAIADYYPIGGRA